MIFYQIKNKRTLRKSVLKILHIIASADAQGVIRSSEAIAKLGHFAEIATLDHPKDPWNEDFPFLIFPLGFSPTKSSNRAKFRKKLEIALERLWRRRQYQQY
jgi:hypothetical protein